MKIFSLLDISEIDQIVYDHMSAPEKRNGQMKLAYLVTQIIFGTDEAEMCALLRETLYGEGDLMEKLESMEKNQLEGISS